MKANERLYLTPDRKKLVRAGHKDAAFLYASPGDNIPGSAAERFGLKDGKLPAGKNGGGKSDKGGAEDKSGKKGDDKSDKGGTQDKAGAGVPVNRAAKT